MRIDERRNVDDGETCEGHDQALRWLLDGDDDASTRASNDALELAAGRALRVLGTAPYAHTARTLRDNPVMHHLVAENEAKLRSARAFVLQSIRDGEDCIRRTGELDFKVGEKGGVSVYGLGRFPVTLYYEQWNRLLEAAPKLREFLEENKSKLKLKEK